MRMREGACMVVMVGTNEMEN